MSRQSSLSSEHAGLRLHSYAYLQQAQQEANKAAQAAADTEDYFHPHITGLARSANLKRAPLYCSTEFNSAHQRPSTSSPLHNSVPDTVHQAPAASTRVTAVRWNGFLSRAAAYERRRTARLRELKMELADDTLRECTFRPRVRDKTVEDRQESAKSTTSAYGSSQKEEKLRALPAIDLSSFTQEMELLQGELAHLRH